MKEILLANNKGIALVDDEDYVLVSKYKWHLPTKYRYPTTVMHDGYYKRKRIMMHNLILSVPTGMVIEHINHNKLDNRRCNLRLITRSQRFNETKEKIRIANSGINSPLYGKHLPSETRIKIGIANSGVNAPWYGKHLTNQTKQKLSQAHKGIITWNKNKKCPSIVNAMHRPDVRKRHIEALSKTKYLGKSVDKGQLELLEKWNILGFNFQSNYQIHTDNFLCYLDGYDKEKNVVLEYDSKYHNKPYQKQKDLLRQQKIIDILNPKKFWRYNSEKKTIENVMKE